jgi:NAD(P)-dependent dehydrogenase (short-subunit alcohol dehydrogenase family)
MDNGQEALEDIQRQLPPGISVPIKLLELDLSSIASVQKAAKTIATESQRLDILMLNAGIMARPPGLTQDGYEMQFGTNYVGHVLLVQLLLPLLETTVGLPNSDVRIIFLSSHGHTLAPKPEGIHFDLLKSPCESLGPYGRYGQSKLAIKLWTRKMAKQYPQFTLASVHPGVVRTNLMNNATGSPCVVRILGKVSKYIVSSVESGAKNQLWASVAENVKSGEYYDPVGIAGTSTALGRNDELAEKLWAWTEEELRRHL